MRLTRELGMNSSKAVLWDMDGTLINSEEIHWIAWRETVAMEGLVITRDQFLSTFGQRNDSIIPAWLGSAATAERIPRIGEKKEKLYRDLVRQRASNLNPGSQPGCTGCSSMAGSKQSPRQRRTPTLMQSWRPSRRNTFSRPSSPQKMFTAASPIQRYTF